MTKSRGATVLGHLRVVRVAKLTATQLVLTDGSRWNLRTGYKVGHQEYWNTPHLMDADEARKAIAEKLMEELKSAISRIHSKPLTDDQLQRIMAILKEPA